MSMPSARRRRQLHGSSEAGHRMQAMRLFVLAVLWLLPAMSASAQQPLFASDVPSPLRLIKPEKKWVFTHRFRGSVELSGRFSVAWITPDFLQATFQPDAASRALLPYERGRRPVDVLHLVNGQRAVELLLDAAVARSILAKEIEAAKGTATITIRAYETSVSCDTRGYAAELVSASRAAEIVIGARDLRRLGC
jgi:hypothetical protein